MNQKTQNRDRFSNIHTDEDIVSLPRALSKLGFCSRTEAAKYIYDGRVYVNWKLEKTLTRRVSIIQDTITVDGKVLQKKEEFYYIVMNKPRGYVTTRADERGSKTVYDLMTDLPGWIFPVGRLDKNTSGLLIFTNDSDYAEKLTNPEFKHTKTYVVKLDRKISEHHLKRFGEGIKLDDGYRTMPAKATPLENDYTFLLTLVEGKNRQIRRMCSSLGYKVVRLHRCAVGAFTINELKLGEWRPMTDQERKLSLKNNVSEYLSSIQEGVEK